MIRTKNLISSIYEVPVPCIFENYLTLPEKLNGQNVKITSIFNSADKNPSMFIYHANTSNNYKWKDFSTGKQGDAIELVKELFNIEDRYNAALKIITDYNNYVSNNGVVNTSTSVEERFQFSNYELRNWNQLDVDYWTKFNIDSAILKHYNVKPLKNFTLIKKTYNKEFTVRSTRMYGYFTKENEIYKIYQPLMKENKFFKVKDYIQGYDQLTFSKPYLIICSSLKDMMAFDKLKFKNAECIAPDSENIIISEAIIQDLKSKYKTICTLFDNDQAGVESMKKYKDLYDLPFVHFKLEKDLADSVKIHGINNTRELIYPLLTKVLTGQLKQL
jgi:hypothetical protein